MYSLDGHICLFRYNSLRLSCFMLAIALLFGACRKEKCDTTPPVIRISQPAETSIFFFQNTLDISAEISDDRIVKRVSVEITSPSNRRYLQTTTAYPNTTQASIQWTAVHDDLYLETGTYYVKITADDGENESIRFREIQLIAAPRTLDRVCIVRAENSNSYIDTLQGSNLQPWLNYNLSFRFGGFDSRSNLLVMTSENPSEVLGFNYPDLLPLPMMLPSGAATLSAFQHDDQANAFYWGDMDGNLFVSDLLGSRSFSWSSLGYPIRVITINATYVVAIAHSSDNSTSYIQVYRKDNGSPTLNITANWEVTGAVALDGNDQLMVLGGNADGAGHFAYLNLNTSSLNENFSFYENSAINGLTKGAGNDFYAAQSTGLVHYVNNFSSYTINENIHPSKVIFDDLYQTVWTIESDEVHHYDATLSNQLFQIPAANAADVWLIYNK